GMSLTQQRARNQSEWTFMGNCFVHILCPSGTIGHKHTLPLLLSLSLPLLLSLSPSLSLSLSFAFCGTCIYLSFHLSLCPSTVGLEMCIIHGKRRKTCRQTSLH